MEGIVSLLCSVIHISAYEIPLYNISNEITKYFQRNCIVIIGSLENQKFPHYGNPRTVYEYCWQVTSNLKNTLQMQTVSKSYTQKEQIPFDSGKVYHILIFEHVNTLKFLLQSVILLQSASCDSVGKSRCSVV